MSEHSEIEWTDATWNPVRGCTKITPGCDHCYAETFAERFRGVKGHPYEQGFNLRLVPEKLAEPLPGARFLEMNAGHAIAGLNGSGQRIHIERTHLCGLEIQGADDAIGLVPLKDRHAVRDGHRRVRRRLDKVNASQRGNGNECRDDEFGQLCEETSVCFHGLPFEWR